MAGCESTLDNSGAVRIPSIALPITCKLQNPPPGVTIAEVEFFPSGSNNATAYTVTRGVSFEIPPLPKGATGNLFVRIIGNYTGAAAVWVVEDCDAQAPILAIVSRTQKFGHNALAVY